MSGKLHIYSLFLTRNMVFLMSYLNICSTLNCKSKFFIKDRQSKHGPMSN